MLISGIEKQVFFLKRPKSKSTLKFITKRKIQMFKLFLTKKYLNKKNQSTLKRVKTR